MVLATRGGEEESRAQVSEARKIAQEAADAWKITERATIQLLSTLTQHFMDGRKMDNPNVKGTLSVLSAEPHNIKDDRAIINYLFIVAND